MACCVAAGSLTWLYVTIYVLLSTAPTIESFTSSHLRWKAQHPCPKHLSLFSIVPKSTEIEVIVSPLTSLTQNTKPCSTILPAVGSDNSNAFQTMFIKLRNDKNSSRLPQKLQYVADTLGLVLLSLILSIVLISFEDISCKYVLPNRHRTSISMYRKSAWGMTTINGMGFGSQERQILIEAASESQTFEVDPLLNVPTYNEVMLIHRTVTIPQWKRTPTSPTVSNAIHTIIESIQQLDVLRDLANDYQWDSIRRQLYSNPISDLPVQSSILRQVNSEMNEVVGFDWGSCAWRHCGAISDIQEAIDEIDQLLGVLEPQEIIFCLDIVERSLRDILSVVPWQQYASEKDFVFYNNLPPYATLVKLNEDVDDSALSRIDIEYVKALYELRID